MSDLFTLPRFQEAIKATPPELPTDTYRRYAAGKLPKTLVRLLIARPDLADALCADIREQSTISKIGMPV
jgi:hypothetical protein